MQVVFSKADRFKNGKIAWKSLTLSFNRLSTPGKSSAKPQLTFVSQLESAAPL